MPFLTRYVDDESRPDVIPALRDLALRAVGPAIGVWFAIVGIGLLIQGPGGGLRSEDTISRDVQAGRTPLWDSVTLVWSRSGNTEIIIGICLVAVALIWWRTRQWWVAVIPGVAIALQAAVFVIATALVGRDRPPVDHLDPAPPTSSYPSGHVGASTALYLSFALIAQRITHPVLRRAVTVACLVIPFLVAWARLYRGMHHVSDIVVGAANGVACALLAWGYLRRRG